MDIDALARDVEHELGIDATYIYGGGRHFPGADIILTVALELICAYLATLLGIDVVAMKHAGQLRRFIERVRAGGCEDAGEIAALKEEADGLATRPLDTISSNEQLARDHIERLLGDFGVPAVVAQEHADSIHGLILRHRRK